MGTTANGETVATTGTTTLGNTTGSPAVQQTGKLVKGAGAGASSAAKKNSNAKCTKEGHPVDVVTGEVVDEGLDLSTPGLIEVEWRRRYSSGFADESTPLGRGGWTFTLHQWIESQAGKTVLREDDGRNVDFPPLADKGMALHRGRRLELVRKGDRFEVRSLLTRLTRVYEPAKVGGRALLRAIRDSRGNAVELRYRGELLAEVIDSAGRTYRVTSDHAGRIVEVALWARGNAQQTIHYTYGDTGELASVTDALGHTERYAYDGFHRLVQATLRNGTSFYYLYDQATGRCAKTWGDGGLYTVEMTYDDDAHANITAGNPEPRCYTYDDRNAIVRQESIDGAVVWERDYDDDLLVVAERNAAGEEIVYEYDARGNLLKRIDPAGNEVLFEYQDDLLIRKVDAQGLATVYERSRFGEIEAVIQPSGWATRARYDANGRLVQVYTAEGELTRAEYDAEHNRVGIHNWRGAVTRYAYDAMGRAVGRVDPIGRRWAASYDLVGQLATVTSADGRTVYLGWDPLGYLAQQTNEKGETTRFTYAGLGALLEMTLPDGQRWSFTYDKNQRLVAVQNPKRELFEYRYDRAGRVQEERTFDGRVLRHGYDRGNRIARTEQPDGTFLAFAYDPLGNVVEESTPDGVTSFVRDATGRLLQTVVDETAAKVVVDYAHDALGRLVKETQNGRVIEREYDVRGWCTKRTIDGGVSTAFAYNLFGEYIGVDHDGHKVFVQRDVLGREIRRHHYDSQLDLLSNYGPMDELVRQRAARPAPTVAGGFRDVVSRTWDYDPLGQLTREEDARWGATSHEYDLQGRLVATNRATGREVFDYDAADALVRRMDALGQGGPTWTSGQGGVLVRTGDTELEYDDNRRRIASRPIAGGVPSGPETEYLWDARGCLREVKKPDGERVRFFYDAFRRRLRKQVFPPPAEDGSFRPTRVIDFIWDRSTLCGEIDSERGKRFFVFAPGSFVPILQSEHGEVFACITDYLGTTRELVDAAGHVAWSADRDAWGRVDRHAADPASAHAGKVESPFRGQGQYWDAETGLAYVWHRYFDPAIGRFLSPDPIELDGGGNLFGLNGAPTVAIDPTGLANPYDVGTYGGQNGGTNVGDGLDADEMLLNGFIKARQGSLLPGNEFGGHGSGNASRDNPTIALPGRGSTGTHAVGHGGAHGQVWDAERAAGLHDPATLAKMTAKQVIDAKAKILEDVLKNNGFSAKDAKKKVEELKKKAIAHAKNIFPPCVHGF